MNTIYQSVWSASESWWMEKIFKSRDETFRVKARHNAYESQSFVKVEVWTTKGWSEVHTANGYALKAKRVSYAKMDAAESDFEPDVLDAIAVALRIVGPD